MAAMRHPSSLAEKSNKDKNGPAEKNIRRPVFDEVGDANAQGMPSSCPAMFCAQKIGRNSPPKGFAFMALSSRQKARLSLRFVSIRELG